MRLLLLSGLLIPLAGFGQSLLPPSDPMEPVTGGTQQVTTAEQRASLRMLLLQAANHYQMHAQGTPAHIVQVSFTATASTSFAGGTGILRETWISGQNWRWDATLGAYSLLRISSNGVAYDQQPLHAIPLRLKMLANALFAPLTPNEVTERTAQTTWKGTQVTCILRNVLGGPRDQAGAGRTWGEAESCIDPLTGLLMMESAAPGIYVGYDYTNALRFHDRILPGSLTIWENGTAVVEAQLANIADTDASDHSPFTPTAQMKEQGPAITLGGVIQGRDIVRAPDIQAGSQIAPAVVHVTFDEQGAAQESEVLQSSGMSQRALSYVTGKKIWANQNAPGAPPRQREAYILVEFQPPLPVGVPMRRVQ
jgi:hypothetical protein